MPRLTPYLIIASDVACPIEALLRRRTESEGGRSPRRVFIHLRIKFPDESSRRDPCGGGMNQQLEHWFPRRVSTDAVRKEANRAQIQSRRDESCLLPASNVTT